MAAHPPQRAYERALNPDGRINVTARGRSVGFFSDFYHSLLTMSWSRFMAWVILAWLGINVSFALLYMAGGSGISNTRPDSLLDHFFFSVQTLSTVGYGGMVPQTLYANVLVAIETFSGLLTLAVLTGLIFAKFSRPTARVRFTTQATISNYDGMPSLSIKLGNERGNQILDARVKLMLVRSEVTQEGERIRRFYSLPVTRPETAMFVLTWTIIHPIDASSPLRGETVASLLANQSEILIVVTGVDETFAQTVHARRSYLPTEIVTGKRFVDLLSRGADGRNSVDYNKFDDLQDWPLTDPELLQFAAGS